MDIATAFQIVLDLARQNIRDQLDDPKEHANEVEACNIIEDVAVNKASAAQRCCNYHNTGGNITLSCGADDYISA